MSARRSPGRTAGVRDDRLDRLAFLAAVLLLVGAGVVAVPMSAAAAACPPAPTTVAELRAMVGGGATWDPSAPVRCLGDRILTIRAFVARPDGIGGVRLWSLSPAWFEGWRFWDFVLFDTARTHNHAEIGDYRRYGDGDFYFVVAPLPSRTLSLLAQGQERYHPLASYEGRLVIVRGHFDDQAAGRCRITRVLFAPPPPVPTPAQTVMTCRETFVLDSVGLASAPATSTEPTLQVPDGHPAGPLDPRLLVMGAASCAAFLLMLAGRRSVGPA
jgi:hypothetical protein